MHDLLRLHHGSVGLLHGRLMAVDIVPKRVTGAAMGMIGLLSYAGAALQEFITGKLMTITVVNGVKVYDFGLATGICRCSRRLDAAGSPRLERKTERRLMMKALSQGAAPFFA